jgi:hypothetical protein
MSDQPGALRSWFQDLHSMLDRPACAADTPA